MRKISFTNREHYHIFNRGVDKRQIFLDQEDVARFVQSMDEFNVVEPIGSIYENSFRKTQLGDRGSKLVKKKKEKLVNIICYCINPNHYHFILEQVADRGIEKFMHRLGVGYSMFFNKKYKRSGTLFQGRFKAVHIDSNEQLLHTSVYVNLNDKVHKLGVPVSKLVRSSWSEYVDRVNNIGSINDSKKYFCKTDIVLDQFKSKDEYKNFTKEALSIIKENKEMKLSLIESLGD